MSLFSFIDFHVSSEKFEIEKSESHVLCWELILIADILLQLKAVAIKKEREGEIEGKREMRTKSQNRSLTLVFST